MNLCIVDFGMGNVGSVHNALTWLGANAAISSDRKVLTGCDALILPGVGAFPKAVSRLRESGLYAHLEGLVCEDRRPILGICLGLQLMVESSEELGHTAGFGWLPGRVVPFEAELVSPHVGWAPVGRAETIMFAGIDTDAHFFFDHNYRLTGCLSDQVSATCHYGSSWPAALVANHIWGTQFHPEKSQRNGLKLLRNFLNFVGAGHA